MYLIVSETCIYDQRPYDDPWYSGSKYYNTTGLHCNSGECIRESYFCNGISNCNDTSDASFCGGKETVT